jgi:ATP-dependent DNA ligase
MAPTGDKLHEAPRPEISQGAAKSKIPFIEPMYALTVQKLPEGKEWLYEVKFDGYRCLAS